MSKPQTTAGRVLGIDDDLVRRWKMCRNCGHSPGQHGGAVLYSPEKPCLLPRGCDCSGYEPEPAASPSVTEPETPAVPDRDVLYNHIDEMFVRADIIWGTLDQHLKKDCPEKASLRELYSGYYDALMENMDAVSEAAEAAALAASPTLDVERLRTATTNAIAAATEDGPDLSDLIAAEYARLTPQPGKPADAQTENS